MGCSGFWTGCKSGSRRSFLHDTDNRMVWILNRMLVRVQETFSAWCWQWAALAFEQFVSQGLAVCLYLMLIMGWSVFWTACKSGSTGCFCFMLTIGYTGFKQNVRQLPAGFFHLMLTMCYSGFWSACKLGFSRPFPLDAYDSLVWPLNSNLIDLLFINNT